MAFACLHRNLLFVKEKTLLEAVTFRPATASCLPDEGTGCAGKLVSSQEWRHGEKGDGPGRPVSFYACGDKKAHLQFF